MATSRDGDCASSSAAVPFWGTSTSVHLLAAGYFTIFALIAITLHSNLGIDNAIENYNAQSLELFYSPRNPPLYVWILYGIQQVTGPGKASFAILNYGSLFACVMVLYRVAKRAIHDPRMQALSVYAYCLLWEFAHESHRILTHSNLMIVAIAATVLSLLLLAERATFGRFLLMGFWIGFGLLSKFGFIAFLAAFLAAALAIPRYREVLKDRRIIATLAVSALLSAPLWLASPDSGTSIPVEIDRVLATGKEAGFFSHLGSLLRAAFGYVIPLLPVAGVVFFRSPAEREDLSEDQRDIRSFLGILICIGIGFAVLWALVLGSTQLRSRYFHSLLLLFPILLFSNLGRYRWPIRPMRSFLLVSLIVSVGIMIEQVYPLLAPSEKLFGTCERGIPFDSLGDEIEARFGKTITLVGLNESNAGRLRAAVPEARVLTMWSSRYRPPLEKSSSCVLVWHDEGKGPAEVMAAAGVDANAVESIDIPWFQPLMSDQRVSRFYFSVLPESSEVCQ